MNNLDARGALSSWSLPFRPNVFQRLTTPCFERGELPSYIFRVHDGNSMGITNTTLVEPIAYTLNGTALAQDVFRMDPIQAANILNGQSRWKIDYTDKRYLTCWTSSPLLALQYRFLST
jgi:hypothetical protein